MMNFNPQGIQPVRRIRPTVKKKNNKIEVVVATPILETIYFGSRK